MAQKIDTIFDTVIITGKSNAAILEQHIHRAEKIVLQDKTLLQSILSQKTVHQGFDSILNDAQFCLKSFLLYNYYTIVLSLKKFLKGLY